MLTAAIMAIAVILSGSRAGMLAVAIAMSVWFLAQSKIVNQKTKNLFGYCRNRFTDCFVFLQKRFG
jgi:hypothetical protein